MRKWRMYPPPSNDDYDSWVAQSSAASVSHPDAFEIPSELVGRTQMVQPVAFFLLAAGALLTGLITFFGNHRPVHWQLITGVSVETAVFLALAASGFYALRHAPSLKLSSDGLAIHGRLTKRRLAWEEVTDVRLKVKSGEGVTFVFPAITDTRGKVRLVGALMETPRNRWRAEEAVARLLATRDQELSRRASRN
jgi:hypothetical protein